MYNFPYPLNNKIAVIGDAMLDHYLFGMCDRISPEAPVQVVDIKSETYTLGGAANVLKNLMALGCQASFITVCGNDESAKILDNELKSLNPHFCKLICDRHRKTTVKTRVVASQYQLIRLDREDKNDISANVSDLLLDALNSIINDIEILILSDYCKGVLSNEVVNKITSLCKRHNVLTIVDSKAKDLSKYYNVDIVKPNKKEASIASGILIEDDQSLALACKRILEITNCETVIVTLSEEGISAYHDEKLDKIPTKALEVFDVTGAGDTVIAALAFALANKMTVYDACDFANHAAAVVVAKVGSATATVDEINMLNQ